MRMISLDADLEEINNAIDCRVEDCQFTGRWNALRDLARFFGVKNCIENKVKCVSWVKNTKMGKDLSWYSPRNKYCAVFASPKYLYAASKGDNTTVESGRKS